jgi:hypothetical protein
MFKPQNQKYVDLQLYLKNATKYFHNFLSKFESLIIAKTVLFQTFQKNPRVKGAICICVLSSSRSRCVEAPRRPALPPPARRSGHRDEPWRRHSAPRVPSLFPHSLPLFLALSPEKTRRSRAPPPLLPPSPASSGRPRATPTPPAPLPRCPLPPRPRNRPETPGVADCAAVSSADTRDAAADCSPPVFPPATPTSPASLG